MQTGYVWVVVLLGLLTGGTGASMCCRGWYDSNIVPPNAVCPPMFSGAQANDYSNCSAQLCCGVSCSVRWQEPNATGMTTRLIYYSACADNISYWTESASVQTPGINCTNPSCTGGDMSSIMGLSPDAPAQSNVATTVLPTTTILPSLFFASLLLFFRESE